MDYLIRRLRINARFMISIHDEIRYLVKEEEADRAALALQVANLWVRSLFTYQVGMSGVPLVRLIQTTGSNSTSRLPSSQQ